MPVLKGLCFYRQETLLLVPYDMKEPLRRRCISGGVGLSVSGGTPYATFLSLTAQTLSCGMLATGSMAAMVSLFTAASL